MFMFIRLAAVPSRDHRPSVDRMEDGARRGESLE
jgi:hypothetical protein